MTDPVDEWFSDRNRVRRFRRGLRKWYAEHGRDLPWRRSSDPYVVWISEIMLQQTTVAAVVPYFERFLERFPDVHALASAEESDVLRLWEGLGYYSRARNLHRCAQRVVAEREGAFPESADELQALPGIGRYTAGAIASFGFDRRAPIVEANTLRLYSRLLGDDGDPRSSAGQRRSWAFAERVVPAKHPGRFNQALMELGATVCRLSEPDCDACPVKSCCVAFREGRQAEIPPPKKRPGLTDVTEAAVAVERKGKYLLRRRGEDERWAGLWDFPRFELPGLSPTDEPDRVAIRDLEESVRETTGIRTRVAERITVIRHGVTRFRIRLFCFRGEFVSGRANGATETQWVRPAEFEPLPLSTTGRKLARLLS